MNKYLDVKKKYQLLEKYTEPLISLSNSYYRGNNMMFKTI